MKRVIVTAAVTLLMFSGTAFALDSHHVKGPLEKKDQCIADAMARTDTIMKQCIDRFNNHEARSACLAQQWYMYYEVKVKQCIEQWHKDMEDY